MSTFTVKSTMPTGKANEKFGKEFYVQFDETEQAFPLWFKEAPEVGKQIEGEITNGKFKKIRKEWKPQDDAGGSSPSGGSQPRTPYKDNSDGMRQGMCFNNAANFVNTLVFEKTLTDREWADLTFAYAQALYRKGDLNVTPEGSQEEANDPVATVKEVFGGGTKLVTPRGN
jgi:hypothetical protein